MLPTSAGLALELGSPVSQRQEWGPGRLTPGLRSQVSFPTPPGGHTGRTRYLVPDLGPCLDVGIPRSQPLLFPHYLVARPRARRARQGGRSMKEPRSHVQCGTVDKLRVLNLSSIIDRHLGPFCHASPISQIWGLRPPQQSGLNLVHAAARGWRSWDANPASQPSHPSW